MPETPPTDTESHGGNGEDQQDGKPSNALSQQEMDKLRRESKDAVSDLLTEGTPEGTRFVLESLYLVHEGSASGTSGVFNILRITGSGQTREEIRRSTVVKDFYRVSRSPKKLASALQKEWPFIAERISLADAETWEKRRMVMLSAVDEGGWHASVHTVIHQIKRFATQHEEPAHSQAEAHRQGVPVWYETPPSAAGDDVLVLVPVLYFERWLESQTDKTLKSQMTSAERYEAAKAWLRDYVGINPPSVSVVPYQTFRQQQEQKIECWRIPPAQRIARLGEI